MSDAINIPESYLNKSQIAVKYSISRVTVDRYLKKLESEGRLFPTKVHQGKRVLYNYDPNDLDEAFKSLLASNKKQVIVQKNVSNAINVQNQSQIELLRVNLQNAEKRLLEKDDLIADLKEQREKNYKTIEFLQTQITDQRPKPLGPVYQPPKIAVVPQKIEPNVVQLEKAREQKPADENEQEIEELDATLEEVMDHFDPTNSAEQTSLEAETATQPEPDTLASLAEIKEAVSDAVKSNEEPEETVEAVDKIEDGAIGPDTEEEPAPKKGFWNWIKGY